MSKTYGGKSRIGNNTCVFYRFGFLGTLSEKFKRQSNYYVSSSVSRIDNKTPICPACGVRQALSAAGIKAELTEEIVNITEQSYAKTEQKRSAQKMR